MDSQIILLMIISWLLLVGANSDPRKSDPLTSRQLLTLKMEKPLEGNYFEGDIRLGEVDIQDLNKNLKINTRRGATWGGETGKCEDYNVQCSMWKQDCFCTKYPNFMEYYCKKSCSFCTSG